MAKNSGHTMGKMPGNMMAHKASKTPFQNTGFNPGKGVSPIPRASAQPAAAKDGMYKMKLETSIPGKGMMKKKG